MNVTVYCEVTSTNVDAQADVPAHEEDNARGQGFIQCPQHVNFLAFYYIFTTYLKKELHIS